MDMQVRYEKLRADAAECAQLRDLATDAEKRELFGRLSDHLNSLASLIQRAVELRDSAETMPRSPSSPPRPPPAEMVV
jgi:hypothetical protein